METKEIKDVQFGDVFNMLNDGSAIGCTIIISDDLDKDIESDAEEVVQNMSDTLYKKCQKVIQDKGYMIVDSFTYHTPNSNTIEFEIRSFKDILQEMIKNKLNKEVELIELNNVDFLHPELKKGRNYPEQYSIKYYLTQIINAHSIICVFGNKETNTLRVYESNPCLEEDSKTMERTESMEWSPMWTLEIQD